jgi:hypothetical protein
VVAVSSFERALGQTADPASVEDDCYAGWTSADVQDALDRYASQYDWQTHDDANRAGLPWGSRVYGETLRRGSQFRVATKDEWLRAQRARDFSKLDADGCFGRFISQVVEPGLLPHLAQYGFVEPTGFVLSVEQDSVIPPPSDKDYTMGVILEWNGGWVDRSFLARGMRWLDWPGKLLHRTQAGYGERFTFQFGNSAFAPLKENLARTDPMPDDRPYASLLFVTVRRTSVGGDTAWDAPKRAVISEWAVGLLGLNISREVQTFIHKGLDDTVPGGWHNQISQGGEPTARYRLAERLLLPVLGQTRGLGADLTVGADANLGFYTNASIGARARLGLRQSTWWDYERTSPAPFKRPAQGGATGRNRPFEIFLFASGGGTLWAYNELLQGGFRASAVRLGFDKDPAPMNHGVFDCQLGGTVSGWKMSVTVSWSQYTALFGGPNERPHRWWTFSLGF